MVSMFQVLHSGYAFDGVGEKGVEAGLHPASGRDSYHSYRGCEGRCRGSSPRHTLDERCEASLSEAGFSSISSN